MQMVLDPNIQFTGALKSKKKADLLVIGYILGLLVDGKQLNNELCTAIQTCLLANPSYRSDSRFNKLYPSFSTRADNTPPQPEAGPSASTLPSYPNTTSENIPPSSQPSMSHHHPAPTLARQATLSCSPSHTERLPLALHPNF